MEGEEGRGKREQLGFWLHLRHPEKEGDLLAPMVSVSDKRMFSNKGWLIISTGSLCLNKSHPSLPVMHRQIQERLADFEWKGCLQSVKGQGKGHRKILQRQPVSPFLLDLALSMLVAEPRP